MLYWKIPLCTDNPEKTRTVAKNILQIDFSFIFITTFYREGRCCNPCVFFNYEGIHVDTAVGCVLICFTILCLIYFVIDRVGNCIIPSAAYHISCKITVKQLVKSQIR